MSDNKSLTLQQALQLFDKLEENSNKVDQLLLKNQQLISTFISTYKMATISEEETTTTTDSKKDEDDTKRFLPFPDFSQTKDNISRPLIRYYDVDKVLELYTSTCDRICHAPYSVFIKRWYKINSYPLYRFTCYMRIQETDSNTDEVLYGRAQTKKYALADAALQLFVFLRTDYSRCRKPKKKKKKFYSYI